MSERDMVFSPRQQLMLKLAAGVLICIAACGVILLLLSP